MFFGILHGIDDVRIAGATAQIAAHVFADVGVVFGVSFDDAGDRGHDLSRRAVAALEGVVIDERLLHGMQRAVRPGEAFDRRDLASLRRRRKREAGENALAVHQDGASAALTVVAAFLGAGETDVLTQRVEKARADVERQPALLAIDVKTERERLPQRDPRRRVGGLATGLVEYGKCHGGRHGGGEEVPAAEAARSAG